jgi:Ca2+-binding RTX toxin-like protein
MAEINGNDEANNLPGTEEADIIDGRNGDDILEGLGGDDILIGSAGNDIATYERSPAAVFVSLANSSAGGGHAQGDILFAIEGVIGSNFADVIFGDVNDNFIDGLAGLNTLVGGGGDDIVRGTGTLEGNDGDDDLRGGLLADKLRGGAGNDRLVGLGGADILDGGAGVDIVSYDASKAGVSVSLNGLTSSGGDAQGDVLIGIENVVGSFEDDDIFGDASSNELDGLNGDDALKGGGGADRLIGGVGEDSLLGDGGNDTLIGGFDADKLFGGDSVDTADYFDSNAGVSINLASNIASGGHASGDTFSGVENISGSNFADTLIGDGAANTLLGGNGVDTLKGGGGADTLEGGFQNDFLVGGDGADKLKGGTGDDSMTGGAGDDTYSVDRAGDTIDESILGGSGIDTVTSQISFSLASSNVKGAVEKLTLSGSGNLMGVGNALANTLVGNSGANQLNGNSGADRMVGGGGNDNYTVNEAGDVVDESAAGSGGIDGVLSFVSFDLSGSKAPGSVENLALASGTAAANAHGNALANVLSGNNGINVITGAAGNDTLTGKGAGDFFVFATALNAATNVDVITDYSVAQDTMRLENAFFTGLATGTLAASAFRVGTAAADASDRVIYNNATGALFFDKDGSGGAGQVRFATLDTGLAVTSSDFVVI